jgi:hypothetical protein
MKMKIWDLTIITFALALVGIIISGYILGQKYFDFNVWIALFVYSIPALILSGLNGVTLVTIEKISKNLIVRFGIGLLPILVLVSFLLFTNGPLEYIAVFGLIPLLITNSYWFFRNYKTNKKASIQQWL